MLFFSASSFRNWGAACVPLSIPEQNQLMNYIAKGYLFLILKTKAKSVNLLNNVFVSVLT